MTTIDTARPGLEGRLRDFLSAAAPWLRPARDTGNDRVARLDAFLAAAHPYLHRRSPAPLHHVDPTRLGEVIRQLRDPLERQRVEGRALNVWSVAGLGRDEVRNTAVLAELLRHERLGNVARAFLFAIVDRARATAPRFPEISTNGFYRVSTEVCPLGERNSRVDLVIETDDHLLGIEVKIGAREGLDQLTKYDLSLTKLASLVGKLPALIFLSPRAPASPASTAAHITWLDIHRAARRVARQHPAETQAFWMLTDFADHARTLR